MHVHVCGGRKMKSHAISAAAALSPMLPSLRSVHLVTLYAASITATALALGQHRNNLSGQGYSTWTEAANALPRQLQIAFVILVALASHALYALLSGPESKLLLLDLHCFKIPERLKMSRDKLIEVLRQRGTVSEDNLKFLTTMLERNGLGPITGVPEAYFKLDDPKQDLTLQDAMEETQLVIFDVVDKLLKKTGIHPSEIGMVVTACSCFAPTPSMASMLVNRFKLRRDVLTYSLAGMGCSASLICVDMAKHQLKSLPNTLCLIVNHENCSSNVYLGNDRSMITCNSLFRIGGAAIFVTNRPCDQRHAKYELCTSMRMHFGADDDSYLCMGNGQDESGNRGIYLRKTIIGVTTNAMTEALNALAPHVLPFSELAKYAWDCRYKPNFAAGMSHFLLHLGGKGVLEGLQKALNLPEKHMAPAYATLWRFGNMSAASTWYILAKIETEGVRKGEKLWQLGIGGGFKANSAIWRARRNILQHHECWE